MTKLLGSLQRGTDVGAPKVECGSCSIWENVSGFAWPPSWSPTLHRISVDYDHPDSCMTWNGYCGCTCATFISATRAQTSDQCN
jgi:hypothetical protein